MAYSKSEREQAIARLRELLKPGDSVFTVLRSVSRSGMTRGIDLYVFRDDEPLWLSGLAARALGYPLRNDSVRVGGCGMDMGFHLVYGLGNVLWPDGVPCTGDRATCQSNEHVNPGPNRDVYDLSVVHRSGGYALRHRWLG